MKRISSLVAVLLALVGFNGTAADDAKRSDVLSEYSNKRTIDTTNAAAPTQGLVRLQLPLDVYRGVAHGDLRDVRIFNAKGERVPIAIVTAPDRTIEARTTTALPIFPITEDAANPTGNTVGGTAGNAQLTVRLQSDGTLISLNTSPATDGAMVTRKTTGYLVDASRLAAPIHAMHFAWEKSANSETGRVTIEASTDLNNWRAVVRDAPLIDLAFNGRQLSQKTVLFGAPVSVPADKYLRLTWAKQPFTLTGLDVESVANTYVRTTQSTTAVGVAGKDAGEYTFGLAARLPIEQVRLLLPDANTLAPTQLSIKTSRLERKPGGKIETVLAWQPVANATFYRLSRDGIELVSPAMAINNASARGAKDWQAMVDARGGGVGAGLPTLEVTWQPQQIVFATRGDAPFTLAFGRLDASPANFAVSDLMPGYKPGAEFALPSVVLQAVTDAPKIMPPAAKSADGTDWKKVALWAVLVIGVALLAWMAVRLGRDVGSAGDSRRDGR